MRVSGRQSRADEQSGVGERMSDFSLAVERDLRHCDSKRQEGRPTPGPRRDQRTTAMTDHQYLAYIDEVSDRRKRRRIDAGLTSNESEAPPRTDLSAARHSSLAPAKRRKAEAYTLGVYNPDLEALTRDFSREYLSSARRPVNFVLGTELENRFDECVHFRTWVDCHDVQHRYPKLRRLIELHGQLVRDHAHPPTRLAVDLRTADLLSLKPMQFDAILIDAPLDSWSWQDIEALPIPQLAAGPSFIWLWVGSGSDDGLERGRAALSKWGYRCASLSVVVRIEIDGHTDAARTLSGSRRTREAPMPRPSLRPSLYSPIRKSIA